MALQQSWVNDGGPPVMFLHATGFCKEVWRPVVFEVAAAGVGFEAVLPDQRAHGESASSPHPLSWWALAEDALALLGGRKDVIGVGHSLGGAVLAMAELLAPGTFRSLVLIEPIISPPPFKRQEDNPLAVRALRRRPTFPSLKDAADRYRSRTPFITWDERAFAGYLEGGFEPDPDGGAGAVRLACNPADEAEFFRSAFDHRAWGRLGELSPPIEIIAGEKSDTHPARFLGLLAGRMPRATVTIVPDADHFVPMQRPEAVAAAVAACVAGEWSG